MSPAKSRKKLGDTETMMRGDDLKPEVSSQVSFAPFLFRYVHAAPVSQRCKLSVSDQLHVNMKVVLHVMKISNRRNDLGAEVFEYCAAISFVFKCLFLKGYDFIDQPCESINLQQLSTHLTASISGGGDERTC